MANTFEVISSQTLNTNTSTISFNSIPQTYTDLVLRITTRSSSSAQPDWIYLTSNSNTGSIYSWVRIQSNGSASSAARQAATTPVASGASYFGFITGTSDTADSFASVEMYIPSYTNSTYSKQVSVHSITTNNATLSYQNLYANLIGSSAAISSISLSAQGNFVSGSSFILYGVKKN